MKKRILAIMAVLIILFGQSIVHASYVKDAADENSTYYISAGKEVKELFDFKLKDIPDIMKWVFNFKTFVVLKEFTLDDGTVHVKGYFNTPNLQSLAKNLVINEIADGYTDDTYNVNETQGYVKVGDDADKINAITKYGFKIPNYTYYGEFPKSYMSVQNIIPTGFFDGAWRFIRSLFGLSFLNAPDASNYSTISYFNHGYTDNEEVLIKFIQNNWIEHFVNRLNTTYFYSDDDFKSNYTTEEQVKIAKEQFDAAKYTLSPKVIDDLYKGRNDASSKRKSLLRKKTSEKDGYYVFTGKKAYDAISTVNSRWNELSANSFDNLKQCYENKPEFKSALDAAAKNVGITENVPTNETVKEWYSKKELTEKGIVANAPSWPQGRTTLTIDDIMTDEARNVQQKYQDYKAAKSKFESFKSDFDSGNGEKELYYNQCLIENEGEDKECWSRKRSDDRVTLAIGNVYSFSGVADITKSKSSISRKDAIDIIQKLQAYCGPYYKEVMSNIIICMVKTAKANGLTIDNTNDVDLRVMPYDVDTMIPADRKNFTIIDERVGKYKSSFVGKVVSDVAFTGGLGIYMKMQPTVVNLAGKITELSIFMQQLINFDLLDSYGLSPASMWSSAFVFILMMFLVLLFVVKTVMACIHFVRNSGKASRIFVLFLVLFLELGFLTAVMLNPEGTWKTIKNSMNAVMNLGEESTVGSDPDTKYLFGDGADKDFAVAYYLPYLDTWSQYNTGYGLLAKEQFIPNADGKPESINFKKDVYTLNANAINHWSVLLIDAFEQNGSSESVYGVIKDNKLTNGKVINHNAYRVVDHFIAPRITTTKVGDAYELTVTENEHYNGNFQAGFIEILTKLLNVVLLCILTVLKLLTFGWLWFQLYIFIFKAILARTTERKNWPKILADTFGPLLGLIGIGTYAGLCIRISSYVSGIVGLLIVIGQYAVAVVLVRWWSTTPVFPLTLKPIGMLLNMHRFKQRRTSDKENADSKQNAEDAGINLSYEDMEEPDKYRHVLFDDKNQVRDDIYIKSGSTTVYEDYAKHMSRRIKNGYKPNLNEIESMENYNRKAKQKINTQTFEKEGRTK